MFRTLRCDFSKNIRIFNL